MVLSDSMAKYVSINACTDVQSFRGDTVWRLTDRIAFNRLSVKGYARILIHVGANDLSNMVDEDERYVTVFTLINRFKALRNVIRRQNKNALLLFSSVLPRVNRYHIFKPLCHGLNFALEKMCARSKGSNVFVASYKRFISFGSPREELFAENDGLHLNGAGVVELTACFQQALSTGHLMGRVGAKRRKRLAKLPY